MGRRKELEIGSKHQMLTVVCEVPPINKAKSTRYKFLCDCGNYHEANRCDVVRGSCKSCGCLKSQPIEVRFKSKYSKHSSGCWNWIGAVNNYNYGKIQYKGKLEMAHRVSYTLHKGTIPSNIVVRHTCDNSLCVNPDHLELGNKKENMEDHMDRGRNLTRLEAAAIRTVHLDGMDIKDIASVFKVSVSAVSRVVTGKTFR